MLLYYITDRLQFPGTETEQRRALLAKITEAARAGVDYIQLREKDLHIRALEQLTREAVAIVAKQNAKRDAADPRRTALLINSRIDVALACGADGVHLTSSDLPSSEARILWSNSKHARRTCSPIIAVSCHSVNDVESAASHGADFAVLAPIFEKAQTGTPGIGLSALRAATGLNRKADRRVESGDRRATIPVLALGGVTPGNAQVCLDSGAAGIAGIRLFQEADVQKTIDAIRKGAFAGSAKRK